MAKQIVKLTYKFRSGNRKVRAIVTLDYDLDRMRRDHGPWFSADKALMEAEKIIRRKLRDKESTLKINRSDAVSMRKLGKPTRQKRARRS